jgi:hypothetical protein
MYTTIHAVVAGRTRAALWRTPSPLLAVIPLGRGPSSGSSAAPSTGWPIRRPSRSTGRRLGRRRGGRRRRLGHRRQQRLGHRDQSRHRGADSGHLVGVRRALRDHRRSGSCLGGDEPRGEGRRRRSPRRRGRRVQRRHRAAGRADRRDSGPRLGERRTRFLLLSTRTGAVRRIARPAIRHMY